MPRTKLQCLFNPQTAEERASQMIARRVADYMFVNRMKMYEFADQIGVNRNTLSMKMHGEQKWTLLELIKIARITEIEDDGLVSIIKGE